MLRRDSLWGVNFVVRMWRKPLTRPPSRRAPRSRATAPFPSALFAIPIATASVSLYRRWEI